MAGFSRALHWKLRTKSLTFEDRPKLMGIVNVTPDSFSDGGKFYASASAIDQALRLEDEGADIIDIGGESTRPYSEVVAVDEERRRVLPVVEALIGRLRVPLSIDTTKAEVADACLSLGAEIINDVSGLTHDPGMLDVARRTQAAVCVMHMQGTPQTMQDDPHYQDVIAEVGWYLDQRLQALVAAGIDRDRICLDPGIGFGKTHAHNLELLQSLDSFHRLGCPLLVGHSRKGFIAKILGDKSADRTWGTIGASLALASRGVQVLRVHDIRATKEALLLFEAAGGLSLLRSRSA
jgi:dihydropteroate synthase